MSSNLISSDFTDLLRKYIEIDNEMKEIRTVVAKLKEEKTKLSKGIQVFMIKKQIDEINLPDSKLTLTKSKTIQPLTKKIMEQRLIEYGEKFLNDPERANHMIEFITSSDFRETIERTGLRRTLKKDK
jgi:hypothetical protein